MYMHHMKHDKLIPYFTFVALGIIWGTNFLFMKMSVEVLAPLQVVWLRVIFGSIPILGFAVLKGALKRGDFGKTHHFIAMSIFANVLPYYFFVKGTQFLTSGVAGVISGTIPLMTAVLVMLVLPSENLTWRRTMGLLSGLIGVVLITQIKSTGFRDNVQELMGAGFMIMGSLSYAVAMVYARKFVTPLKMTALQLTAYQTLCASVLLIAVTPMSGIETILTRPYPLAALVLGLGLVGTGFAFVMYYYIIDQLGVVTASSVYYIPPLVALLIGFGFRGEMISASQAVGALAIIVGINFSRVGGSRATQS